MTPIVCPFSASNEMSVSDSSPASAYSMETPRKLTAGALAPDMPESSPASEPSGNSIPSGTASTCATRSAHATALLIVMMSDASFTSSTTICAM